MCLAVPVKVRKIDKNTAQVDMAGATRTVDIRLLDGVRKGDYILVHAGFGIEKINAKEAKETLKLLKYVSFGE
jgi:hydrogenase expression/formation protein HypC